MRGGPTLSLSLRLQLGQPIELATEDGITAMALELLSDFPGPAQLAGEQSTRLQHNSQFFDTVVNLFPPSVYLTKPEDSDDENQGNSRFFKVAYSALEIPMVTLA